MINDRSNDRSNDRGRGRWVLWGLWLLLAAIGGGHGRAWAAAAPIKRIARSWTWWREKLRI